ncbi:DNA binding domain protein, excisionase family, partial [mine drainage metagenome]
MLGLNPQTLIRWGNEGKIKCIRLPNNYRKVPESEIRRLRQEWSERKNAIYARVSSRGQ